MQLVFNNKNIKLFEEITYKNICNILSPVSMCGAYIEISADKQDAVCSPVMGH
jgi:hypothetical protein